MFTVEVGAKWTGWSSVDNVKLKFAVQRSQSHLEFHYEDTWMFMIGMQFKPADIVALRLGYYWDQAPVTDEERSPTLPDDDRNGLSFGIVPSRLIRWDLPLGRLTS